MIRHFKALGLAMLAALALSAVAASAAQAEGSITTNAGSYPATVVGTQTNENVLKIGAGVREVTCSGASLTGELPKAQTEVTITPSYSGCTAKPGSTPATVTTNSCDYLLTADTKTAGGLVHGTIHIFCLFPGDGIDVHIYENHAKHTANESLCTYRVTPQTISGITSQNEGSGTGANLNLEVNSSGIKVDVTSAKSKLLCGGAAGETVTASYTGKLNAVAKNGGANVGLMIG